MKITILLPYFIAVRAFAPAPEPTPDPGPPKSWLFSATGYYTGLAANTFKMSGTTNIIAFTDRPSREAKYDMSLGDVVSLFHQEPGNPPNAVVTVTTEGGEILSAAMVLSDGSTMNSDEMGFKFSILGEVDDNTRQKMGGCSMCKMSIFVDSAEFPLCSDVCGNVAPVPSAVISGQATCALPSGITVSCKVGPKCPHTFPCPPDIAPSNIKCYDNVSGRFCAFDPSKNKCMMADCNGLNWQTGKAGFAGITPSHSATCSNTGKEDPQCLSWMCPEPQNARQVADELSQKENPLIPRDINNYCAYACSCQNQFSYSTEFGGDVCTASDVNKLEDPTCCCEKKLVATKPGTKCPVPQYYQDFYGAPPYLKEIVTDC